MYGVLETRPALPALYGRVSLGKVHVRIGDLWGSRVMLFSLLVPTFISYSVAPSYVYAYEAVRHYTCT